MSTLSSSMVEPKKRETGPIVALAACNLNAFAAGLAGTGIDARLREWYPQYRRHEFQNRGRAAYLVLSSMM